MDCLILDESVAWFQTFANSPIATPESRLSSPLNKGSLQGLGSLMKPGQTGEEEEDLGSASGVHGFEVKFIGHSGLSV